MGIPILQIPDIILPTTHPLGTEQEAIDDLLEHTSTEFESEWYQEKEVYVLATEVLTAGVPGNLWCWIELSPWSSTISTAFWAAIGGGGGALVPVAPVIEVATGVNGTVHSILIPWAIHSSWARVVIQTPVSAAIATATWDVQVMVDAKGP